MVGSYELTTQSSSGNASGTSRPRSTDGGQGTDRSFSITVFIVCVRTSDDQERLEIVSYTTDLPR